MSNRSRKVSLCARAVAVKKSFYPSRIGARLFCLLMSSLVFIASAEAATITVGSAGDSGHGNAANCDAVSTCTLRDAIAKAAAVTGTTPGDAIVFSLPANSTITLSGSALVLDRNLTIDGSTVPNLGISGNHQSGVFENSNGSWWDVVPAAPVVLNGLVIKDGNTSVGGGIANALGSSLVLINSIVSGNTANSRGGGIINFGTLVLNRSTISGNAVIDNLSEGGGIYNDGALILRNSKVTNNMARGLGIGGGGIYNNGAALTLIQSTVSGNTANGNGGGIYNRSLRGISTLINSTVSGNSITRADGGGISNFGVLTLTNSTISNNMINTGSGGGIHNSNGYPTALTLINSTVSGNAATYGAGGIDNLSYLKLIHTTLAANTISGGTHSDIRNSGAVTTTAMNTVIQSCAMIAGTTQPLTDSGGNLDSGSGCGFTEANSKSNATLNLGALADNGGPTLTMMPGANSDAIGRGVPSACVSSPVNSRDQRGYVRSAVTCTSGAVDPSGAANDSIFFDGFGFGGQ